MGEGELKKQLKMLTSFATRFVLSDEEHIKINEIIQQLARINNKQKDKIIDEAKKDFPFPIEDVINFRETGVIDLSGHGTKRIFQWFLKYFGDSS